MRNLSRAMLCIFVSQLCAIRSSSAEPIDGTSLAEVERMGEGERTLLLIPCMSCRWESFEPFMRRNTDRFTMYAVTLPGFGGSPRPDLPLNEPEPVWQTHTVAALSDLIDQEQLSDITVVGHSIGSSIGVMLAAERPDVVTRFIDIDGNVSQIASWIPDDPAECLASADEVVETQTERLNDPETWQNFNATSGRNLQSMRHHGSFMATDRTSLIQYWRENYLVRHDRILESLEMPILDLYSISPGNIDPAAARAQYLENRVDNPNIQTIVIENTTHFIHDHRPAILDRIIEAFLADEIIDDIEPIDERPFLGTPLGSFGHVERVGRGSTPLILMPCLGCDWRSWDEFMERHDDRYTMFAVTWPGLGDTRMPAMSASSAGTPLWDNLMLAIANLILEEDLRDPIIVGHSAAAVAAVRFAHEYPELVGGVVSVDALITNGDTLGYSLPQRLNWADDEMKGVRERYDNEEAWAKLNAPPKLPNPERATMYGEMWLTPERESVLRYWGEWLRHDAGSRLRQIDAPLLSLIAIRASDETPKRTITDRLERYRNNDAGPNVTVAFINDSGHTIWEYQPDAFDEILARFVAGEAIERSAMGPESSSRTPQRPNRPRERPS